MSLREFPVHARIHAETGELDFTPAAQGDYAFTILLENDFGADEQSFVYEVRDPDDPDASVEYDGSADAAAQDEDGSFSADADADADAEADVREGTASGGCSCRQASANRFPRDLPPRGHAAFLLADYGAEVRRSNEPPGIRADVVENQNCKEVTLSHPGLFDMSGNPGNGLTTAIITVCLFRKVVSKREGDMEAARSGLNAMIAIP